MRRQGQGMVHDSVGVREAAVGGAVRDLGESGLAQDVAGPDHAGGHVAVGDGGQDSGADLVIEVPYDV